MTAAANYQVAPANTSKDRVMDAFMEAGRLHMNELVRIKRKHPAVHKVSITILSNLASQGLADPSMPAPSVLLNAIGQQSTIPCREALIQFHAIRHGSLEGMN